MCSLAPRAAAPRFGATAFLDRQRGVVAAVMAPAATSCHKSHNAGEPARRARASEVAAAPARKRGRHDGSASEHGVVDPAPAAASSAAALRIRMDAELVALQALIKRAKLLPRSSAPAAEKKCAAPRPLQAAAVSSSAAKRRTSQCSAATASALPPAKQQQQQQQRPVQHAAAAAKTEALKKQPSAEEIAARAAAREEFRQMLLEMEKSALPDETVYPEELAALGIPFEFVTTRTWKQALEDHAKILDSVAV